MQTLPRTLIMGFKSIHAIAVTGLLLGGPGTATSRADILYVSKLSSGTGSVIERFTSSGGGSVFAATDPLGLPQGLAFDSTGNLYVANVFSNTIEKFTPGGIRSLFASTGLNFPYGLAFDRAGNLYASNFGDSTIEKFTPGGVRSVFASTGVNQPHGLAFDSAGNLFVANSGNNSIEKFTSGGVGSVFATGLFAPEGLAFDGAGNLYEADPGSNSIMKFTSGGGGSVFASDFNSPYGLAFDSAGILYATNFADTTIEKFTPGGTGSLFASGGVDGPTFLAFTDDAGVPLRLPGGPVPEPSTWTMLAFGTASLLAFKRTKSTRTKAEQWRSSAYALQSRRAFDRAIRLTP